MTTVQERLKLKRVPIDTWSVKEKLCLASAVLRSGDQNWMSVSRSLRLFGEPGRPGDWFSQKSCALQYGNLLENVDTPKRKKRTDKSGSEHVETPGEAIVRNLTHERICELKRLLQEERALYLKVKEEVAQIKAGQADDKLAEMCQQIEEEGRQKERDAEAHRRWLQERQEKKIELERAWKPPAAPSSPHRKKVPRGAGGNRRNSSQSEQSSEAESSAVDSPMSETLNVDTVEEPSEEKVEAKPVVPTTPTSPLLTSLLKSPSPAPTAQTSILHSAITSSHHRPPTSSPTIASLLHSTPGIPATVAPPPATVSSSLKNLVTSAIGGASSEEPPKPPTSSPAAGEVCHPQHQEMRVRREIGTDEPVEVVEVEQHTDQVVEVEVEVDSKPPAEQKPAEPEEQQEVSDGTTTSVQVAPPDVEPPLVEPTPEVKEKEEVVVEEPVEEVEVPAPQNELDIVIVDSCQEEVPPDSVVEILSATAEPAKQEEVETAPPEPPKEEPPPPAEVKEEEKEEEEVARIEVLAIEIPEDSPPSKEESPPAAAEKVEEEEEVVAPAEEVKEPEGEQEVVKKDEEQAVEEVKQTVEEVTEEEEEEEPPQPPSTGGKAWKEEEEEDEQKEKPVAPPAAPSDEKPQAEKVVATLKPAARAETPSTEDDKTNDAAEPPRSSSSNRRKPTSADSVPNSPAAPLTDEDREHRAWKKAIMLVYGRLATHKYASLFLRPITDDQAPGYSSIVHRPIDLFTIKKNIETGVTRTTAEFQRDVMLMFLNSIMYNKSSHFVHKMARQMQQECMQHIQDFLTTQMLVQVVGEAPLRRETRTTEANKQRDLMSAPEDADNKRKRSEGDRSATKKRKLVVDE